MRKGLSAGYLDIFKLGKYPELHTNNLHAFLCACFTLIKNLDLDIKHQVKAL